MTAAMVLPVDNATPSIPPETGGWTVLRVIVYLRVSTDEQAESGLGLEAQLAACRALAARMGWEIAIVFEDDLSGGLPLDKRPILLDAIAALARGDILLVAKRDRLGRGDIMTTAMIEAAVLRAGARIVSAAGEGTESDDPSAVLMRRMIDAFAEYERLVIKARTRAALAAKKARGERTGQVPYGSRLTGEGPPSKKNGMPTGLATHPAETEALKLIRALGAAGWSRRQIAGELDRRGIPTKSGRPWKHSTVHDLLNRPADEPA
jgi:site-specific DNA recombinase